ncbi:hypothetical protein [Algibacter sp. 2305UL17-15]
MILIFRYLLVKKRIETVTPKWNKIEHRLFSYISKNFRANC